MRVLSRDPESVVVKVPGDQNATVAELHAAIACSKLNIPMSYQRLIKFRDNGVAVVLKTAEAQLVRDCNVWSGEDVVVEVMMFGEDVDGNSDAIKTFDATRNMIQIQFNSPQDVPASHVGPFDFEYNHTIDVSLRDCLRDVKTKIAEYVQVVLLSEVAVILRFVSTVRRKLGMDTRTFYLKRNANPDTPQLKNESDTLRDLGIVSGSILHVTAGVPLGPDEYLLKVYRYDTAPRTGFTFLVNVPVTDTTR
jgi:Fe2+ transport system protein FeoA